MKVVLLKDVKGQGKRHEIIDVKDGYGNNFLIKNGLGVLATEESVKRLKKDIQNEIDTENKLVAQAKSDKEQLEKMTLEFYLKTGVQDRVFGSISPKQIAEELKNKNFAIDKKKIIIDTPIASLGFHKVKIELHKNVIAEMKVEIKKEK